MSFGSTVRETRMLKGYGLNEMAERLGISPAYLSRIEREQDKPPRDDLIERIAAILDLRLDDLFVKAARLPPDMRKDLPRVVAFYRRSRDIK
jgi:HTH-type transcriptional regulator, competence development regulator